MVYVNTHVNIVMVLTVDTNQCKCHLYVYYFRLKHTQPHFMFVQYSVKFQLHFLTDNYYLCLTAQICIYFTSVVIFVPIGYLGDDRRNPISICCLCNV